MINVTEQAANKISQQLTKRVTSVGLRLGVKKTGCSGYSYTLEYIDAVNENDLVFESNNIKVFVDKNNVLYLDGVTIDYKRQGLSEKFEFINPNSKGECGCGESFTV